MIKKILLSFIVAFLSFAAFAQISTKSKYQQTRKKLPQKTKVKTTTVKIIDTKTVTYFEKLIIKGNEPHDLDVQTQYEADMRVIVWNDSLIKDYKYSNEAFDRLGYEYVKTNEGDDYQRSKVYRNCSKGIVIEVTEWYGIKISIAMQWYSESVKNQIGYLMFCK